LSCSFAATPLLSSTQQDSIASQCQIILNKFTPQTITPTNAQSIVQPLEQCVKYASCQNSSLVGINHCSQKLTNLYFSAKFNSLPQQTQQQSPPEMQGTEQQLGATEQPAQPTPKKTQTPSAPPTTNTQKQPSEGINWF
ncbi:MAG: hypothetical protein ACD_29C00354G0001, partial [uncultured bacterium]